MKLFWCPRTRSARAIWMLEELGMPYDRIYIDIRDANARTDEFLSASPMGKVPALIDGDVKISESAAICLYLADRYSAGNLAPALDDAERGEFLYWMMFTPGVLEPAMAEKASGWDPNPHSHGWGDFDSMIKTLEKGLGNNEWLLGDRFSAADVMVGSSAVFLKLFNMLPDSPVIESYAERCLARPAYARTMTIDEKGPE